MSTIFDSDRDPLYEGRIRLLQTDPERYFELFPPPMLRFGFSFDDMSDYED